MKHLLLIALPLLAQIPGLEQFEQQAQTQSTHQTMQKKKQTLPKEIQQIPMGQERSVMVIDPKARAQDLAKAFDILRKEKPISKIQFRLADGKILTNTIEVSVIDNGTLLLFKIPTPQGIQYQIISTEDILEITHS